MTRPLVSCLLSTRDRPRFIPQAIRCFLRHADVAAELIVVDGGDEPVEQLCAGHDSVRYIRAAAGASCGACLNIAAEQARGEILQARDDDDYYAPPFLGRAIAALQRAPEGAIVAWDCFHVFVGQEALRFSGHGWSAGPTLTFRREIWRRTPFRDTHHDWYFLQESAAPVEKVCAPELFTLVRHGTNAWRSLHGNTDVDAYFRSLPPSPIRMRDAVEPDDIAFYEQLLTPA